MIYSVKTDFIPLLQNLVASLQPFADANFVQLRFKTCLEKIQITYHPESILPALTQLLCRVITFTPQGGEVTLEVEVPEENVIVRVVNSGAQLDHLEEITTGINQAVTARKHVENGSVFELDLGAKESRVNRQKPEDLPSIPKPYFLPPFFKKLRESLQAHFTNLQNLEKAADARSEQDGIFLKKVNAAILAHLDQEHFDLSVLSKCMSLSRSQLYRRLKPLIRQPPAHYIKFVRLQKAKELIDNLEFTIGEIAFKTGFANQSHFTRAFKGQFGFNPSDARWHKTNEASAVSPTPEQPAPIAANA
jgi:AraC-like DNA-binding protein